MLTRHHSTLIYLGQMLLHNNKMVDDLLKKNYIHTCFFCVKCSNVWSVLFKTIYFIRGAGFVLDMWGKPDKTDKTALGKRGLRRVVSQPQSDLCMFLMCDMFQHEFWCFIQNHIFHTWSRFCVRYVRQNRQVCSGEAGRGLSVSHNPRDDKQQSHKTCRSGICTSSFLYPLKNKGSKKIFLLWLPKYFSVLHLWNELYWQPVSPLFVIVYEIFYVSK